MTLEIILASAAVLLLLADWRQTLVIARNPDRWGEINVVLGRHPSASAVHCYFAVCTAAVTAAYFGLMHFGLDWLSMGLSVALISLEGWCVVHNWRAGIRA